MARNSKNKFSLLWIVGLCSFVALMCNGVIWLLGLLGITFSLLATLSSVASIVLYIAALLAGWTWLSSTGLKKTPKLILQILFLVFAIMCICGQLSL